MNTDALIALKFGIGIVLIILIVALVLNLFFSLSEHLLPALKIKYVTHGKDDFGSDSDLKMNQRHINFYMKLIQMKVILIIICIATLFILCWEWSYT